MVFIVSSSATEGNDDKKIKNNKLEDEKEEEIVPVGNVDIIMDPPPPLLISSPSTSLDSTTLATSPPYKQKFVNSPSTKPSAPASSTTSSTTSTTSPIGMKSLLNLFYSIPKYFIKYIAFIIFFIPSIIYNCIYQMIQWLSNTKSLAKEKGIKNDRKKELYYLMKHSNSYQDWVEKAKELDILEDKEKWRSINESPYYDSKLIQFRLNNIRSLAQRGDYVSLSIALREGLLRNLGGMGNYALFQESHVGTKYVIEEYVQEVVKQLNYIAYNVPKDRVSLDFFYETRQSFGRSALLLSGGATLGMYHLGVIAALKENNLLPRIISGSSVGSIIASFVCVSTDEELDQNFKDPTWNLDAFESGSSFNRKLARLLKKGVIMDIKKLQRCVRSNIGDLTFKEAYDKTNRVLNITVASTNSFEFPKLLNYLTSPNVLIWSAACASCALKFLFEPVELMCKDPNGNILPYHPSKQKYSDGSVELDLPMERLSELFNVNHFIVSQVNPHVIPFLNDRPIQSSSSYDIIGALKYIGKSEIKHRVLQLTSLGLIPSVISGLPPLITQRYDGDITLVPEVTLKDYASIISNPSKEMISDCIRKGMNCTYPKISMIKNHCLIELTLDKIVTRLRNQLFKETNLRSLGRSKSDLITLSPICNSSNNSQAIN